MRFKAKRLGAKTAVVFVALASALLGGGAAYATGNHDGDDHGNHGGGHTPVTICHKPGTPAEHTLVVDDDAVPAHLAHGDYLGACVPAPPVVTEPPVVIPPVVVPPVVVVVPPLVTPQAVVPPVVVVTPRTTG